MVGTKPRFIFGYLFLLGVVAVGMILGSVFWLTARLDKLEQEGVENIVELMVTEKVERVRAFTSDYAHWDLAYELTVADDEDGLYDNLGSGATESEMFDQIVILDGKGQVMHVYDGTESIASPADFDLQGIRPFLSQLGETTPAGYVTVSGIGKVDGVYAAMAVTRITPDYFENLGDVPLPVMVGIKLFTEEALQAIATLTQGTGYAITPIGNPAAEPAVALAGPDGTPVAQLVWVNRQTGTALRAEIMPGVLLVCLGIFAICLFAARYFHQQGKALERAMVVASTDKLTGLLNRSGLDEALRAPKTKSRIGCRPCGRHLPGSQRLQAAQRRARPRGWRQGTQDDGGQAPPCRAPARSHCPAGRRRIYLRAVRPGAGRGGDDGLGPDPDQSCRPDRLCRPPEGTPALPRGRGGRAGPRLRNTAGASRPGDVPGKTQKTGDCRIS
jgi:sensor domain CHASE-containing protein